MQDIYNRQAGFIVGDAIRFVSKVQREANSSAANDSEHDEEESKEPDYDKDKHQLE